MLETKEQIEKLFFEKANALWSLPLIQELIQQNFQLYLVGGTVRDFILDQKIGDDLDFEVHHSGFDSPNEMVDQLKKIISSLKLEYEELSFSILRIQLNQIEIELGPPRQEVYAKQEIYRHDDFKVKLSTSDELANSFRRRDFTLNAMALKFMSDGCQFCDPYTGLDDLKQRKLKNCSDNFVLDPVRLLRMVRFEKKFNLSLAASTEKILGQFNLLKCTDHYILSEFQKSQSKGFLRRLFGLIETHGIAYPEHWNCLEFFQDDSFNETSKKLYQFWLANQKDVQRLDQLQKILRLKGNFFNQLKSLHQASDLPGLPQLAELKEPIEKKQLQDLKKLKVLLKGLELIDDYAIAVFDRALLGAVAKELEQVSVTEQEYRVFEISNRWIAPLKKALLLNEANSTTK